MTFTEKGQAIVDELVVRSAYYQLSMYGVSEKAIRAHYPAAVADKAIARYRFRNQEGTRHATI